MTRVSSRSAGVPPISAAVGFGTRPIMQHSGWLWLALSVAWFAWRPSALSANGAFADSQAILLPRTHPHRIIASSDLSGLVVSDDDGATWSWICDAAIGYFAVLFQLGPAPDETLYAVTQAGLAFSSDSGCTWQHAEGIGQRAGDVFPNPSDPQSVLAVAAVAASADDHLLSDVVAESHDGGRSFESPMFTTSQASITGAEIARSDPRAIYLMLSSLQLQHPYIARSKDAGVTWATLDLSGQLGTKPWTMRILAVDPLDSSTLYIRLSDGIRDALAITRDGGTTMQVALQLDSRMTAFLLRSDAALIVATANAASFISTDAGQTFSPWSDAFHIQALAEKDGALYATANSRADGFAVAVTTDSGSHWRSLLSLEQLRGPSSCGSVRTQCDAAWTQLEPSLAVLSGKARDTASVEDVDRHHAAGGCSIAVIGGRRCAAASVIGGRRCAAASVIGGRRCAAAYSLPGRPSSRSAGALWLFAYVAVCAALFSTTERRRLKPSLKENQI